MKHTFRYTVGTAVRADGAITLGEADAHHLVRVVRRGVGDAVEVIDAGGQIWPATISAVDPAVVVTVGAAPRPAPSPAPVEVCVGLAEWGRIDLLIEKATELGVSGLTLFTSERSRRGDQDLFAKRRERMARLSEAAARQSGQGQRPELRGLVPFSAVVSAADSATTFLLDQGGEASLGTSLRRVTPPSALLVIGPDAGLAPGEIGALEDAGAQSCTLAAATLRAETAAIAACAVAVDYFTGEDGR